MCERVLCVCVCVCVCVSKGWGEGLGGGGGGGGGLTCQAQQSAPQRQPQRPYWPLGCCELAPGIMMTAEKSPEVPKPISTTLGKRQ